MGINFKAGDAVRQDVIDQPADSREGVKKALEDSLRALARNMTAISVGGGEPGDLVDQVVKVAECLIAYNESFATRPEEALIRRALARNSSASDQ